MYCTDGRLEAPALAMFVLCFARCLFSVQSQDCTQTFSNYPFIISDRDDFDVVPRNLTSLYLDYRVDHFGHGTLPTGLGGPRLSSLSMKVDGVPDGRLPAGLFVNLHSLTCVELLTDDVSLQLYGDSFDGLSSVSHLRLGRLGIQHLPDGVLDRLESLNKLDLNNNRLSQFVVSVACCQHLLFIGLGSNNISSVRDVRIDGLPSVSAVDLHGNKITAITRGDFALARDTRAGWSVVKDLNLSANQIAWIEDAALDGLDGLQRLDLEDNDIESLSSAEMFRGLSALTYLSLANNNFPVVPAGVFRHLASLRSLDLASGHIAILERGALDGLDQLESIDLSNNELQVIDVDTFNVVRESLELAGNPWICDCRLFQQISRVDLSRSVAVEALTRVVCRSPSDVDGYPANVVFSFGSSAAERCLTRTSSRAVPLVTSSGTPAASTTKTTMDVDQATTRTTGLPASSTPSTTTRATGLPASSKSSTATTRTTGLPANSTSPTAPNGDTMMTVYKVSILGFLSLCLLCGLFVYTRRVCLLMYYYAPKIDRRPINEDMENTDHFIKITVL